MDSTLYPKDLFSALFGLGDVFSKLQETNSVQHSAVLTDFDGGAVRCLTLIWEKSDKGGISLSVKYLFHTNGKRNHVRDIARLEAWPEGPELLRLKSLWLAPEIAGAQNNIPVEDYAATHRVADFLCRLQEAIAGRGEWVNPVGLAQKAGIAVKTVGVTPLPGLYTNGEIQTYTPIKENDEESEGLVYPAPFFSPVLGLGPGTGRQSHSLTVRDDTSNVIYILTHNNLETEKAGTFKQSVTLTAVEGPKKTVWPVYEMEYRHTIEKPRTKRKSKTEAIEGPAVKITKLNFFDMGQGAASGTLRHIDLKDTKSANVALKSVRMLNRSIRAGQATLEDDLKRRPQDRRFLLPTDIFLSTGLFSVLAPADPAPKKLGRFTFRPLGGNNARQIFSAADRHIGANAYILSYYPPGKTRAKALLIDLGVLFHDEFDVTFFNAGRFLRHKDNPAHVPEQDVEAILFTHRHKDHVGQLAYLVKAGYEIPALVMDAMSYRQIKREMEELDVDHKVRDAILEKCHIVDVADPEKKLKTRIGRTTIVQKTESLRKLQTGSTGGFKLGSKRAEYEDYPVLQIGEHFKVHVGPMPHSAPGLCYHVETAAGSHLHMGDPKLDDSIQLDLPDFKSWLQDRKPDTVSVDCTGTTRDDKPTPREDQIRASVARVFKEHEGKRFICPILGSNTARILTLLAAMGDSGRKYLVIDGKALEDTVNDLNEIYDICKWAERNFGVTVAFKGDKEARRIMASEKDGDVVFAVTGTQDEMFSTLNRAIRDWLPGEEAGDRARIQITPNDVVMFLQGPIPVGDNAKRRYAAADLGQYFHGAKVILPELVRDESLMLAGSGHCGPQEIRQILKLVKPRAAFLVHGGPEQLEAGAKIVGNENIAAHILDATQEANVSRDESVSIFRSSPAELIGIHSRIKDPAKFYLKGMFTSYVVPLKPLMQGEFGRALAAFETVIRNRCGIPAIHNYIETQIFALSRMFNKVGVNGYLARNIAFGIDKYAGRDVLGEKKISLIAAFDTETTGLNAEDHRITQFALAAWGLKGKQRDDLTVDIRQSVPDYVVASPEALLVTSTSPETLSEGLHPVRFAEEIDKAFKKLRRAAYEKYLEKKKNDKVKREIIKVLALAHNKRFDDRMIYRTMAESLHHRGRPHHYRGVISMDTRIIARALLAYAPKKFKFTHHLDESGNKTAFPNLTLGALCAANGIKYDESKAHKDAMYDLKCCHTLFEEMRKQAPEIVGQMIINADHGTGHLVNDMTGGNLGFDNPHPVFTYVSPNAERPQPQMGCFVSMLDGGRRAVVFNLKYNPENYLSKSTEEIASMVADRNNDVFELLDLRDQPIVMPARLGFRVGANQGVLKETLDRRAAVVKSYTLYKDPAHNLSSLEERIENAYAKLGASQRTSEYEPDLQASVKPLRLSSGPSPLADAYANFYMAANIQLHRTNRASIRFLKAYREALLAWLEAKPNKRPELMEGVSKAYRRVRQVKDVAGLGNLDIVNIHYDINPADLSRDEQETILRYRRAHGYRMTLDAKRQLEKLKTDTARYKKYVGRKTDLLKKIEAYLQNATANYSLNDDVRDHIHGWRRGLKQLGAAVK
ncbi:MAG: hypothetical protein EBQ96_00140 [Proteobacteria bacterium]|nr:hypothetical protein [Pseudomonadota bacterium]